MNINKADIKHDMKNIISSFRNNWPILVAAIIIATVAIFAVRSEDTRYEKAINTWISEEINPMYDEVINVDYEFAGLFQHGGDYKCYNVYVTSKTNNRLHTDSYMLFVNSKAYKKETTMRWFKYVGEWSISTYGG